MKHSRAIACMAAALWLTSAAAATAQTFEKKEFNHSGWTKGIFSEAVTVTGVGKGKHIFLAGVGAEDENGPRGTIRHKGDLTAQCEYAYDKIKRVLAAHGATMAHVVKLTAYLTDIGKRLDYVRCYAKAFEGAPLPAKTLVGISGLAFPDMLVEVDVTAMTPE